MALINILPLFATSPDYETIYSDDSDEEDEEAALQAELAKIREEREAAKAKADAEAAAEEQSQMEDAALVCNPLLDSGPVTTGKLK